MNMMRWMLLLGLLLADRAAAEALPTGRVELGGRQYTVELALSHPARMRGLMFREALPQDHGMLFVFEREQPLAFWMKNTLIPLDILYFDDSLRLVSISADTPPCRTPYCPNYPSARPARYVLELNAGHAQALQLEPGAVLRIDTAGGTPPTLD